MLALNHVFQNRVVRKVKPFKVTMIKDGYDDLQRDGLHQHFFDDACLFNAGQTLR